MNANNKGGTIGAMQASIKVINNAMEQARIKQQRGEQDIMQPVGNEAR